jgi:hypothetical protein
MLAPAPLFASLIRKLAMTTFLRAFAALLLAVLAFAPDALAQTGQQKYTTWCQGCHGNPANNKDNVLGGKDWTVTKLAMDTKKDMTQDLRPAYNAGLLTDNDFMLIAGYLQTFGGGVTSQLSMPSPFAFGTQSVGVGSSVQTKNVSSIGNAAVQISSIGNSNPAEFAIVSATCTAGGFVNPLSSCSISVQFTPLVAGARSGTITIASNGTGSPQSITMSGTGQSAAPPPAALTVPASLNLGSAQVGVQTAGSVLTISNASGSAATVTGAMTSSAVEFPIVGITCASVAPGANCTITVAFKPQASGARNGTLTVTDTGTGSPHTVTLSGTGISGGGPTANKVQAIEYFHPVIGHYFLTAQADEQFGLDQGLLPGWSRTGNAFFVWDGPTGNALPVFRLFTVDFASKAAHFYTTNVVERDFNRTENGGHWTYEKIAYYLPAATGGTCPVDSVPIYRMFNNGQTGAPNHRFTTSLATYTTFTTTQGWAGEGVVFCAPQ